MSMNPTIVRRRRIAVATLAGLSALTFAGTAGASAVPVDSVPVDSGPVDSGPGGTSTASTETITVLDEGDPTTTIVLPGSATAGQSGTNTSISTATGTVVASGSQDDEATIDVVTTIVQDGEIVAVDDEGGFQMQRTVTSYEVDDNSIGASGDSYANDAELGELVGIPLLADFAASGVIESLAAAPEASITPDQQAAIDEAFESANSTGFPTVPLGVGARWQTVLDEGERQLTATYTLSAIDGDSYTIDVAMKTGAEAFAGTELPNGFDEVSGSMTGSGRLTGVLGDPFTRTSSLTLEVDIVFTGPGIEVATDVTMVEEETTVPN